MDGMEGIEKEAQEGKDMYLTHFVVQEKPTHDCKVTIFPIQKKKKKKKEMVSHSLLRLFASSPSLSSLSDSSFLFAKAANTGEFEV